MVNEYGEGLRKLYLKKDYPSLDTPLFLFLDKLDRGLKPDWGLFGKFVMGLKSYNKLIDIRLKIKEAKEAKGDG